MNARPNSWPLVAAATLLGMGLGGFFDGILFHQLLQLHNMLSARLPRTSIPNIEINMFWDGLFHAFTWIVTVTGLALLWKAVRRKDVPLSTRTLIGGLLLGWGIFNLVEGTINHLLLGLHHVVEVAADHLPYDIAFLVSGIVLIGIGWVLIRTSMYREVPDEGLRFGGR